MGDLGISSSAAMLLLHHCRQAREMTIQEEKMKRVRGFSIGLELIADGTSTMDGLIQAISTVKMAQVLESNLIIYSSENQHYRWNRSVTDTIHHHGSVRRGEF